jgi:hypothetical protein
LKLLLSKKATASENTTKSNRFMQAERT